VLSQLTPESWDLYNWHALESPKRLLMVLLLFVSVLVVDFSTFALKYILWVNPTPYTLHSTPYTSLHIPTPYPLHPAPYNPVAHTLLTHQTSYILGRRLPLNC
jgi:hypothetical protein